MAPEGEDHVKGQACLGCKRNVLPAANPTRGILITDLSTATDLGVNHESERPEACWLTI